LIYRGFLDHLFTELRLPLSPRCSFTVEEL
jgi:hypothetical protein